MGKIQAPKTQQNTLSKSREQKSQNKIFKNI
jgi:hypothetical protein